MKRWLAFFLFLLAPLAKAQTNPTLQGWCETGAQNVLTSGLSSSTQVQQSFPQCTVTVFVHGGGLATIFADAIGTPLSNPFTAQTNGRWLFYVAAGRYDIQLSGAGFPTPLTLSDVFTPSGTSGGGGTPGGIPVQMQVNSANTFAGTPCTTLDAFPSTTQERHDCDTHFKGPNPWYDVTRYGARIFVGTPQSTTANCNGTTSVTLSSAIDFINGDGIVLQKCGPATALSIPNTPTAAIPKGILNGTTTRSYKVVAEDYANGLTAASAAITINNSAATLGLNTINITGVTTSNNVNTITTSATHNLEIGTQVSISGTSPNGGTTTATSLNGIFFVQTTPTGTTFTTGLAPQGSYYGTQINGTFSSGSLQTPAHIWIRWTAQANVMRYWVYRQDGGVGNYNLVGVAMGMDPFFDDYGYTAPTAPTYVPLTAPAAAQNQSLDTTIVSGGGTTNVTLASAASATASGVSSLHDTTPAYLAAFNAAINGGGGNVLFPNTNQSAGVTASYPFNFPVLLPFPTNNAVVTTEVQAALSLSQPLVPGSFDEFVGSSTNATGNPSFGYNNYAIIGGSSYPIVLMHGTNSVRFDHILFEGFGAQSWTILYDGALVVGSGSNANFFLDRCYLSNGNSGGNSGQIPLVMRGVNFNEQITNSTIVANGNTTSNFFDRPAIRLMASSNASPTGWPGIGIISNITLIGGGILFDGDEVYPGTIGAAGSPWTIANVFTESLAQPLVWFRNISTQNWQNLAVQNSDAADSINGAPLFDMSAPTVSTLIKLILDRFGAATVSINPSAAQQVTINGISGSDSVNVPLNNGNSGGQTNVGNGTGTIGIYETGGGLRLLGIAPVFVQGNPPIAGSLTISAGGAVPVSSLFYMVTAVDWNGGETAASGFSTTAVTTTGNQTVNLTWTAPSPAPQGYNVYRGFGGPGGGFSRVNGGLIASTSYSDTFAVPAGASMPNTGGSGPTGMSSVTGVWTPTQVITNGSGKTSVTSIAVAPRTATYPDFSGTVAILNSQYNVYDNFNRANGGLGSNWTLASGTASVSSNTAIGSTAGTNNVPFWNANSFVNDQFAQLVISSAVGAGYDGANVRVSAANGGSWYSCIETSANMILQKQVSGVGTNLLTTPITEATGDILRTEVVGTTITCRQNGAVINTTTDASVTSGSPGFQIGGVVSGSIDNWSGGNLHPIAQLDTEQDWTQPQHFTQPVTIGATNPVAGALAPNSLYVGSLTNGNCVQAGVGGLLTTTGGPCGTSTGTVSTTGAPASGNLTKFSGALTITNADLAGDVTTAGTTTTTVGQINGNSVPAGAAANQLLVGTAANTFGLSTAPNCTDTGGNHLNYNNSTQTFTCGTTSSSAAYIIRTGNNSSVCSTSGASYATCNTTITWNGGGFADTNYEATCMGFTPTQFPYIVGVASGGKTATTLTITISNGTSNGAQISTYASISCIGVHN